MDIFIMLFILCISISCSGFLGHAAGYRRGIVTGRREGRKFRGGYTYMDTDTLRREIERHNDRMGL